MNEALWQRVEAALDARTQPFDDARLAGALAAEPETAAAARRLVARLERLSSGPRAAPLRARPRLRSALLVTLAAGALAAGLFLRREMRAASGREPAARSVNMTLVVEHTTPPPARVARVILEPRRVVAWTLEGRAP